MSLSQRLAQRRADQRPLSEMTYTEGYDLGLRHASESKLPRVSNPRIRLASAGRYGYVDGYADGRNRKMREDAR